MKLTEILPTIIFEEGGEWLNAFIPPEELVSFVKQLRFSEGLDFDYLFCLTCIDWKTHFTMVYHFSSTLHRHNIVVKAKIDRISPEIETVSDIWRTAEMLEREVYDLFGVIFLHHPDLRRLIMPDDWEGWPLRKDFEDPVNMIKL
ncbi:MAG TPA: NADH-quinone oxidoreductase subunit C [Puia sp.]|nr:NADH-quinone oxidoreductase subunit C [Puia sp.]